MKKIWEKIKNCGRIGKTANKTMGREELEKKVVEGAHILNKKLLFC
ncbi:MAG: hypothetical protein ABIH10_01035 [Spirochaetota bacterium]